MHETGLCNMPLVRILDFIWLTCVVCLYLLESEPQILFDTGQINYSSRDSWKSGLTQSSKIFEIKYNMNDAYILSNFKIHSIIEYAYKILDTSHACACS